MARAGARSVLAAAVGRGARRRASDASPDVPQPGVAPDGVVTGKTVVLGRQPDETPEPAPKPEPPPG